MIFAHNILKRAIEIFYHMRLTVSYKSIYYTLMENTNAIERKMRKKIMTYRFFILYNNMNFYQHVHDTHIFNQKIQINYITKYICFLYSYEQFKDENTLD